jgi:hypothetical protein
MCINSSFLSIAKHPVYYDSTYIEYGVKPCIQSVSCITERNPEGIKACKRTYTHIERGVKPCIQSVSCITECNPEGLKACKRAYT